METRQVTKHVISLPDWEIDASDYEFLCDLSLIGRCRVIRLMFPKFSLAQCYSLAHEFDHDKP